MSRAAVWSCLLALVACAPSPAHGQVGFGCENYDVAKAGLATWLREFYRRHAQPILGLEQRLPNGVSWRVVTDATTRLAGPRVTWMPDRRLVRKVNRFFEARQACAMLAYYGMAADWFGIAKSVVEPDGSLFSTIPRGDFLWQPLDLVTLTYATSGLVSGLEVLVEQGEVRRYPMFNAFVFDLKTEKVLQLDRCGDKGGEFTLASRFRLDNLLDLCDSDAHAKFVAIWKGKIEEMAKTPNYRRYAFVRYCKEDDFELAPPAARFADYSLTHSGLAVHTGYTDRPSMECMMEKSPFNPVIIPYRELEPFMKPGPWRDELLGTAARQR